MLPVQNLNGYDRPWAGGAGTNQLDFDSAVSVKADLSGTADDFTLTTNANGRACIEYMLPSSFAGRTLYMSGTIARTGTSASPYAVQLIQTGDGVPAATTVATYTDNAAEMTDTTVTPDAAATSIKIRVLATGSNDTLTDPPVTVHAQNLRLCAEQGQPWSPYANVCPIYGHTSATAVRIGANFLKPDPASFNGAVGAFADGEFTFTVGGSGLSFVSYIFPNGMAGKTVYLSGIVTRTGAHSSNIAARIARTVNGTVGYQYFAQYTDNEVVYEDSSITIPEGATSITLQVVASGSGDSSTGETMTVKDLRLCLAAGQPFTEYQRNAHTVSFGRTIYGGTLDFVTGVLTATWGYIASYNGEELPAEWISDRDVYAEGATPTTGAAVAYRLASAQTYQLTPQEITTLYGTNNVWVTTTANRP